MAADEVLLRGAAGGVAALRFYAWETATVSLGYFQEAAPVRAHPRLGAQPLVRRASGGAALVHHHEITYALALPAGAPGHGSASWLTRMHKIIATALCEFGVAARLHDPPDLHPAGPLCYRHFTASDLLLGSAKVVGSAQRKQRSALMQHGGILLACSEHTPVLPGMRELAGKSLEPVPLCNAVAQHFAVATGWRLIPDAWTETDTQRKNELAQTKYSSDAWNLKR